MEIRTGSLTFKCSICEDGKSVIVHRTASREYIPALDADKSNSFYVTCPKCFSIFSVEVRPVITLQMNSNLVRGKIVRSKI